MKVGQSQHDLPPKWVDPSLWSRAISTGLPQSAAIVSCDGAPVLGVDDLMLELELILGRRPGGSAPYGVIPANGVPIDDLPEFWRCSPGEALARLARMELSGEARRSGDMVLPGLG